VIKAPTPSALGRRRAGSVARMEYALAIRHDDAGPNHRAFLSLADKCFRAVQATSTLRAHRATDAFKSRCPTAKIYLTTNAFKAGRAPVQKYWRYASRNRHGTAPTVFYNKGSGAAIVASSAVRASRRSDLTSTAARDAACGMRLTIPRLPFVFRAAPERRRCRDLRNPSTCWKAIRCVTLVLSSAQAVHYQIEAIGTVCRPATATRRPGLS